MLREMTRVSDKERLHDAIDELQAGGSTNLGDGIVTGYRVARDSFRPGANNRVILLSDGLANTGNTERRVAADARSARRRPRRSRCSASASAATTATS